MTVRINRPSYDIIEKLNQVDRPYGIAGEAMLRADTPQQQFNLISAGRKNILINGNFKIWQRATSHTYSGTAWEYGSVDRWRYYAQGGSTGTATISKSTIDIDGVTYDALDWDMTVSNDANNPTLEQLIEDENIPKGETVTLSFYFYRYDGTEAMPQAQIYDGQNGNLGQIRIKDGWNTLTAKTQDDTTGLRVRFQMPRYHLFRYKIAACQLEVGAIRTPLEYRTYQEELALCQRYYFRIDEPGGQDGVIGVASAYTSTQAKFGFINPVQMRSDSGTVTFNDVRVRTAVGSSQTATATQNAARKGYTEVELSIGSTSFTAGQALQVRIDYGGSIEVEHEL